MYPTPERLWELFFYNPDTGELIWKKRPSNRGGGVKPGKVAGYETEHGDIRVGIDGRQYYAPDLIWIMHKGSIPKGHRVRHQDSVRNNNRLENFILADMSHKDLLAAAEEENFLSSDRAAVEQAFNRDQAALEHFYNKMRVHANGDVNSFIDQEIGESVHEESSEEASYKMVSKDDVNKLIVSLEDTIKLLKDALFLLFF
jgi:hypothetical protein